MFITLVILIIEHDHASLSPKNSLPKYLTSDRLSPAATPYGSVPILYVDGVPLSQTVAIARYAGTISGLVASTPFKSAIGDEVADTTAEIVTKYFDNV